MNIKNSTLARIRAPERAGDETANTKCYPTTIARTNPPLPLLPTHPSHRSFHTITQGAFVHHTENAWNDHTHTCSDEIVMSMIGLSTLPPPPRPAHQHPSPASISIFNFNFNFFSRHILYRSCNHWCRYALQLYSVYVYIVSI